MVNLRPQSLVELHCVCRLNVIRSGKIVCSYTYIIIDNRRL